MKLQTDTVTTPRLTMSLCQNSEQGRPVVFVHGNVSNGRFFDQLLRALPAGIRGIAPDLRGFGQTEKKPIDATRGLRDFSDDLYSLLSTLGILEQLPVLVGWSVGGGVAMQVAIDHPEVVGGLVLLAPMSPFGFGGTKDLDGTACSADFAGSGGGTANPDFVARLAAGDRTSDSPTSPRTIMNQYYFKPPFRLAAEEEDAALSHMLSTQVGPDLYPGGVETVGSWPGIGPGTRGMNNALSPKYCNLSTFSSIRPQPSVLWIRGADDQIVSDTSLFDLGFLGQLGAVPGWPGNDVFPPQPMVGQLRSVLSRYAEAGGRYEEVVLTSCGHSPHLEQEAQVLALLQGFLEAHV